MKRSYLIIGVIILALGAAAYFVWQILSVPKNSVTPPPTTTPGVTLTPKTTSVLAYWLKGSTLTYMSASGKLEIAGGETPTALSDQTIEDIKSVVPSPDKSFVLVSFGEGTPTFSVFDTEKHEWTPLPSGSESAAWDPSHHGKLAYLIRNGSVLSIRLFDSATKKSTEVGKLAAEDLVVDWIIGNELYLTSKPSAHVASSLLSFNLTTKTFRTRIPETPGLTVRWAPGGTIGLKFTNATHENQLQIISASDEIRFNLPFATIPQKCTFGSVAPDITLYCAVPKSLPAGMFLPDDYLTGRLQTSDSIIAWSSSGTVKTIYEGATAIDATSLSASATTLRFVNRYDESLYEIPLTN